MTRPITTNSRGAASELRAGAYLIDQGYHVFRSESPGSPFDLVAYRDGICYRVEVKTLLITTNAPTFHIPKHQNQWDLLILVAPDRIFTFDSSRGLPEIKGDLREAYGWPRRPPQLRPCGTSAGVSRHRKLKEALCPPCRQAYTDRRKSGQGGTGSPQSDDRGEVVAVSGSKVLGGSERPGAGPCPSCYGGGIPFITCHHPFHIGGGR